MEDNFDINKEKCKELKKIRADLANELNVDLKQKECKYKGKCSGTCPQCQKEEELLNKALIAAGICAGVVTSAAIIGYAFQEASEKFNQVTGGLIETM